MLVSVLSRLARQGVLASTQLPLRLAIASERGEDPDEDDADDELSDDDEDEEDVEEDDDAFDV